MFGFSKICHYDTSMFDANRTGAYFVALWQYRSLLKPSNITINCEINFNTCSFVDLSFSIRTDSLTIFRFFSVDIMLTGSIELEKSGRGTLTTTHPTSPQPILCAPFHPILFLQLEGRDSGLGEQFLAWLIRRF